MPFLGVYIYKAERGIGCDLVAIIKFSFFFRTNCIIRSFFLEKEFFFFKETRR